MDLDSIKRKIRSLQNLAGDAGAAEQEADNALRFARALMLKHQLSEADLADAHARAGRTEATEYGDTVVYGGGVGVVAWESTLARALVKLVGTIGYYREFAKSDNLKRSASGATLFDKSGQPLRFKSLIKFYGPVVDVRDARDLFEEWSVTIAAMARLKFGGALRGEGAGYALGFSEALYERASKILEEEGRLLAQHQGGAILTPEEKSQALVLVSTVPAMQKLREGASAYLRGKGVRLVRGSGSSAGQGFGGARDAGRSDGSRANFSRNVQRKLNP